MTASPPDKNIADSARCAEFTAEISKSIEGQTAEDYAAEARQQQELDSLIRNLNASGASEDQKTSAFYNLTARQNIENEDREIREANEIAALRQKNHEAGCSAQQPMP